MGGLYDPRMRQGLFLFIAFLSGSALVWSQPAEVVQFVFTSDSHYGITRSSFRGGTNVDAHVVNAALVAAINGLPSLSFPADGGLHSGQMVGPIDFVVDGGDVANRAETGEIPIQSAAASWSQFSHDYLDGLTVRNRAGQKAPLYTIPGNHDVSNAIGSYKPMNPPLDSTVMVEIFNRMVKPSPLKTATTFDYSRDKVMFSRNAPGIHFEFITIWPDTRTRGWMESDLRRVSGATPVVVFMHDPPDADPKHFRNPNGRRDFSDVDMFENLLDDTLADTCTGCAPSAAAPIVERRALENFLRKHPNITAAFHGHNNWNQFYDWTGPDNTVVLHTFRVDSPMKGHFSGVDETKLSFQLATIDVSSRTMTVREVLWNPDPRNPHAASAWGSSTTVALSPRPHLR